MTSSASCGRIYTARRLAHKHMAYKYEHKIGDLIWGSGDHFGTIVIVLEDTNTNYYIVHWFKNGEEIRYTQRNITMMKDYFKRRHP